MKSLANLRQVKPDGCERRIVVVLRQGRKECMAKLMEWMDVRTKRDDVVRSSCKGVSLSQPRWLVLSGG